MAELRAPEQNRLLGQLARMLRTTEGDIAAPEFLPKGLDVMGLVRQLMLPSAETVEKMSYGDPLFRMPTQSNIPITADREYLADIAGMIPFGAPAARPSARAMQDLVRQIQTEPPTGAISPEIAARFLPETKVVDEAGKPVMVYHGSDDPNIDFSRGAQRGDSGIAYFSDADVANTYALFGEPRGGGIKAADVPEEVRIAGGSRENAVVYPSYVDIKNPAPTDYNLNNAFDDFGVKKIVSVFEDYQPDNVKVMREDFDFYKEDGGDLSFDDWVKDNASGYLDLNAFGAGDESVSLANYPGLRFLMHTDLWQKSPYDGLIYRDSETNGITYSVKNADQIRSAISDPEMAGLLNR